MDARLLRDSTEPATPYTMCLFSKGGVYSFTHKALRIIQEFIQGNAIEDEADHLIATLATLPTPRPPLLRVKRIPDTKDELVITQNIVYSLFSSMCGREPNRGFSNAKGVRFVMQGRRNELLRPHFKITSNPFDGKISAVDTTQCVEVQVLTHWLLAFTALNGAADAVQIGAEFVRFGLILLIKAGKGDTASYTRTVRGPRSPLNPVIAVSQRDLYVLIHLLIIRILHRKRLTLFIPWIQYTPSQTKDDELLDGIRFWKALTDVSKRLTLHNATTTKYSVNP